MKSTDTATFSPWALPTAIGALLLPFVTANASGQDSPITGHTRGLASDFPLGVVIGGNASLYGMRIKGEGDGGGLPPLFDPSIHPVNLSQPDYASALTHPNFQSQLIEIDGHSTGNAQMPRFGGSDSETSAPIPPGVPNISPGSWYSMAVSIRNKSRVNPGSHFNNAGKEVVSYYFKDNENIDPEFVGAARWDLKRFHLGIAGSGSSVHLNALDYGVGFIVLDDPVLPVGFFANHEYYYFSVTTAYVAAYASGSTGTGANFARVKEATGSPTLPPRAGDIYRRKWTASGWSTPERFYMAEDLGLNPDGNVDAFDLSAERKVITYSVSSASDFNSVLVPPGQQSQLMIYQELFENFPDAPDQVGPTPVLDRGNNGGAPVRVTNKLGLIDITDPDPADVTTLCQIDPEAGLTIRRFGIPVVPPAANLNTSRMGMSISRCRNYNDSQTLTTDGQVNVQVTGWGDGTSHSATMWLLSRRINTPHWVVLEQKQRSSADHAISFRLSNGSFIAGESYEFLATQKSNVGNDRVGSVISKLDF